MRKYFIETWNLIRAVFATSALGRRNRMKLGLMELLPQTLYLGANTLAILTLFKKVGAIQIENSHLIFFALIMCTVDATGDALFFKGIGEYCSAMRRGQLAYYFLTPAPAFLKVLFLRWDFSQLVYGLCFAISSAGFGLFLYGWKALSLLLFLPLGILVHIILTSGYFIIQAYFDPKLPLPFGSPASRIYTKPVHLVFQSSVLTLSLNAIYPSMLMTAFPAGLSSGIMGFQSQWDPRHCLLLLSGGLISLLTWHWGLSNVVKKACVKWQK